MVNWEVKAVAANSGQRGVRCNGILPGVIKTVAQSAWVTPEIDAVYLNAASSPRLGLPEDIAAVASFLESDESAFVNGALWTVASGNTCLQTYVPGLSTLPAPAYTAQPATLSPST